MSAPHSPSLSSGFLPMLCNIAAIIPIMTQFVSLYPCNNPQHLRVIWGYTAAMLLAHFLCQISEKSDIFPRSAFSTKSENHLKKLNENNASLNRTTYNDLIVIHGPVSVLYALSLTGWHFAMTFRKPIFAIEKKKKKKHTEKCWTYTVNRESVQNMGNVISLIGIFWLQQAFNKHTCIQCLILQLLGVCIDVIWTNKSILLKLLDSSLSDTRRNTVLWSVMMCGDTPNTDQCLTITLFFPIFP